jgi:endonuclease G
MTLRWRRIGGGFAAALVLGLLSAQAMRAENQEDSSPPGGLPKARGLAPRTWTRTLHNEGFVLGYSELRRNPLWVAYRAVPVQKHRQMPRPERFEPDPRTLARVTTGDYSRSGYTRGHLAPNYLISQLYGRRAQKQTFLMSNVAPQRAHLNQKLWQRLEEVEADHFVRWFDELWVITGPLFDDRIEHMRSGVEIPDAFFRIFLDSDARGEYRMLAFLVPQDVRGDEPLDRFVTSVADIEAHSGFDFFSGLDDDVEARVESSAPDAEGWRLKKICCLPPRY